MSGGEAVERTRNQMTFGFPRMHKEKGELRDFLPTLIHQVAELGCPVLVESGIGSGMGFVDRDYADRAGVEIVDDHTPYEQDVVLVLRAPTGRFESLRPGATLISMLHFPTRPARVRRLERLGHRPHRQICRGRRRDSSRAKAQSCAPAEPGMALVALGAPARRAASRHAGHLRGGEQRGGTGMGTADDRRVSVACEDARRL